MSRWEKIAGTQLEWFYVGNVDTVGIGRDGSGNLIFKDEVVGFQPTLTELLEGNDDDQVKAIVEDGDTFTVKEDHQHIVFDEFAVLGDGEYVVEGESILLGGDDSCVFEAEDDSGETAFADTWVDVPLDSVEINDGYSHSLTEDPHLVGVPYKARYEVDFSVGVYTFSHSNRTTAEFQLLKNGSPIAWGGELYLRDAASGRDAGSKQKKVSLVVGDELSMQVRRTSGGSSLRLKPGASNLSIARA